MFIKIRKLLDFCILAGIASGAVISVLALLGAFIPLFDVINHFQLVIMALGFIALAASFVWPSSLSALKIYGRKLVVFILFCSLIVLGPEILGRLTKEDPADYKAVAGTTEPVRLMSFNIYMGTWDRQGLADTVIKANPDIVTLQEFAPKRFRNQPDLKRAYPHQATCQSWRVCSLGILSKHRITDIKSYQLGSSSQRNPLHGKLLAVTVHPKGAQPFRLYNVHLTWPLPLREKQGQLEKLTQILKSERKKWPLQVLAGDFNSTSWAFRLRDFSQETAMWRRDRLLPTFPSPNSVIKHLQLPALLSLDHFFTSPQIGVGDVVRISAPIGDHWPIAGTLYIPKFP
ncbi:endonuclease/exonuclease/phosphatase family protein [uncultured Cohaesibacter sp.]|uniref:endonuclease/exonuclease/phosphatase family protein n=1 Tax=uncultured Cohaesibacter sp. TaxID=1002546 RepID=UPI0029C6CF6D|nr:endonuclease/exonuclease/phosphatase family protein [uncultured Cohaesibacter sp.]